MEKVYFIFNVNSTFCKKSKSHNYYSPSSYVPGGENILEGISSFLASRESSIVILVNSDLPESVIGHHKVSRITTSDGLPGSILSSGNLKVKDYLSSDFMNFKPKEILNFLNKKDHLLFFSGLDLNDSLSDSLVAFSSDRFYCYLVVDQLKKNQNTFKKLSGKASFVKEEVTELA